MDEQIADRAIRARLSDVQTEVKEWRCYTFNISDGPELIYSSRVDDDETFTVTELVISATRTDGRRWLIDWINVQGPGTRNPIRARKVSDCSPVPEDFAWVQPYIDWVRDITDHVPDLAEYPLIEARESIAETIRDAVLDMLIDDEMPPSLGESEARRIIGADLDRVVESGELIKLLDDDGEARYPAFQFDVDHHRVIPLVAYANSRNTRPDWPIAVYARAVWWTTDQGPMSDAGAAIEGMTTPLAALVAGTLTEQIIDATAPAHVARLGSLFLPPIDQHRPSSRRVDALTVVAMREVLAATPTYTDTEARQILGETVDQLVDAGELIALRSRSGAVHYPMFQFDQRRNQMRDLVAGINQQLGVRDDPWGCTDWWINKDWRLGDRSPLECLDAGDLTESIVASLLEDDSRGM